MKTGARWKQERDENRSEMKRGAGWRWPLKLPKAEMKSWYFLKQIQGISEWKLGFGEGQTKGQNNRSNLEEVSAIKSMLQQSFPSINRSLIMQRFNSLPAIYLKHAQQVLVRFLLFSTMKLRLRRRWRTTQIQTCKPIHHVILHRSWTRPSPIHIK